MPRKRNDDAAPILVGLKVEDLIEPHTASVQAECDSCRAPIWVAKSSPKAKRKMCLPCAVPYVIEGAKLAPLTQKQIDDVIRHRGWRWR